MKRSDGITVDGCGMFCGTVFDGSAMEQRDAMGTLLSKVSSNEDSLLDVKLLGLLLQRRVIPVESS